jgi:transposase
VFKDEVPGLAERIGVPAVVKELGLQNTQLYSWHTEAKKNANQSDIERAQATEIARLKRQLAEQVEEISIVKKLQHTSQRA